MSKVEVIPPRRPRRGAVMRSARYYLALMQDIRRQAELGLRSSADAQRTHAMAGAELEVFMHVKLLEMRGQGAPIDVAPEPEEHYEAPRVGVHRAKKVTVRRGLDKGSQMVDEETVTIASSGPGDPNAEVDAQIEALT